MRNVQDVSPSKLLIVDDEPLIRALMSEVLAESGFSVRSAPAPLVSDGMISNFQVCAIPPLRQKKVARMGHGRWYINKLSEIQASGLVVIF